MFLMSPVYIRPPKRPRMRLCSCGKRAGSLLFAHGSLAVAPLYRLPPSRVLYSLTHHTRVALQDILGCGLVSDDATKEGGGGPDQQRDETPQHAASDRPTGRFDFLLIAGLALSNRPRRAGVAGQVIKAARKS